MTTEEHFWSKVDKSGGSNACWPWIAGKNSKGYGWFRLNGTPRQAHRVAFFLTYGHWPEPECRHTCHNRVCCNGAHLLEGTRAENEADKVAAGRQARGERHGSRTHPERVPRGERNGNAKLTEWHVRIMRRLFREGKTKTQIAREFGVGDTAVHKIVTGKRWRNLMAEETQ